MAGSIVSKSTRESSIISGNPQKDKNFLTKKFISKINNQNKNYTF